MNSKMVGSDDRPPEDRLTRRPRSMRKSSRDIWLQAPSNPGLFGQQMGLVDAQVMEKTAEPLLDWKCRLFAHCLAPRQKPKSL